MERVILISDYHQRKNNNHIFYDKKLSIDVTCKTPWETLIINQFGDCYICVSPAWLPKSIGSILDFDNIYDLLNSPEALLIREEIIQGRYFYCNSNICSHFFSKIDRSKFLQNSSGDNKNLSPLTAYSNSAIVDQLPKNIIFDFDYTCNFVCPSCRTELINNNKGSMADINDKIVEKIKNLLIDKIDKKTTIRWAGGEPFISRAYLEIWKHIITTGNKNIRNIIQTNGSYLKKQSDLLLSFLPYIDILRVSFDAGRPETYTKIRVNGIWDNLIDNVRWARSVIDQNKFETKIYSDFVVQLDNYLEIPDFVNLSIDLKLDGSNVVKMWNWGTWSPEEFNNRNISDKSHPDYQKFLDIIRLPEIKNNPIVFTTAWQNDI